jgi:signal transduction histidine kinase
MIKDNVISNKMIILGKLTARFTHELRNPLTSIKLNLDYLQMVEDELPDHINETISSTVEAFNRVQHLVESILNFSRQSNGNTEKCDLNAVSLKAINIVKGVQQNTDLLIETKFTENLPLLEFDENGLLQVFLNLITNAIEACDGAGKIEVRSYIDINGYVCWVVNDNGVGIEAADHAKIFNDFFTKKTNGTGLGLGVCKRILAERNAQLSSESEVGKGTTFYIKFDCGKN